MNDDELISILYEHKFSKKQVINLVKLSEKYSISLYETVTELARRFPRSLFIHILVFLLIIYQYLHDCRQDYYTSWFILFYTGVLLLLYGIFDLFAPLLQGYKARKVVKAINKISEK
ncbi:hypothetical protein WAC87_003175 [Shigella flexneri]